LEQHQLAEALAEEIRQVAQVARQVAAAAVPILLELLSQQEALEHLAVAWQELIMVTSKAVVVVEDQILPLVEPLVEQPVTELA
jgi:hypothetical protein